jgi:hypothetical protein
MEPRYEWPEVNRWVAEGGLDGYGAVGDTAAID